MHQSVFRDVVHKVGSIVMRQPGFCSHPERAIGRFVDRRDAIINQAIEGRESGDLNTIIAHASTLQFPKAQPNRSQRRSAPH